MNRRKYQAVERVVEVARLLGKVSEQCVFVGGAAIGLILTDPAIADVRPTLDVDVIVELATRVEYYQLQESLRGRGFSEDNENNVICRWKHGSLILDVMPTQNDILGFANRWYPAAYHSAQRLSLDGISLFVISPAYFLATKLEAFYGRGGGDYLASHDLEDFIAVLDGRMEIVEDITRADFEVRSYLSAEFSKLLDNEEFRDALPAHLPGDFASQARVPLIEKRMEQIALNREATVP